MGIVYLATCKTTKKSYVGCTVHGLADRIKGHVRKSDAPVFHKALKKYGVKGFDFAVLAESESQRKLFKLEHQWIGRLGCLVPYGYNLVAGGKGFSIGHAVSEKTREAVRKASVGRKNPFLSELNRTHPSQLGRVPSEEKRKKMSESAKRRFQTAEGRRHLRRMATGHKNGRDQYGRFL